MRSARGSRCRPHGRWTGFQSARVTARERRTVAVLRVGRGGHKAIVDRTIGDRAVLVVGPAVDQVEVARASPRASRA